MKFGPVAIDDAAGAILAHSIVTALGTLRKGHCVSDVDIAAFREAGIAHVVVARLDAQDVGEDAAAAAIAGALVGPHVRIDEADTGRANLYASTGGVLIVDRAGIDALNGIDPGLTIATLAEFAPCETGRMVATVKIIPFSLPRRVIDAALALIAGRGPLVRLAPYIVRHVGVVSTMLPSLKPSVIDKTLKVMADRLKPTGAAIVSDLRVPHQSVAIADGVRLSLTRDAAELVVIFGASAVVDRDDVIPSAIALAGGEVQHFGMPVDPGNLLLLGRIDGHPVLGAPGCARSPRENGFDWILSRLMAGVPVTPRDILGLGVGGLLMDIVSRPRPREVIPESTSTETRKIAALVLAAGKSSRMGGPNKLLATLDGKALIGHAVDAALGSRASSVTVVTGHMAERVSAALDGRSVAIVHNPDFAEGMSTSLKAGLAALPADVEAVIVLLADMPRVTSGMIDQLIAAYEPARGSLIVLPTFDGRRGNPVLWSRRFFADLIGVTGDIGARNVIGSYPEAIAEVELGPAVALDLDTPDAIEAAGGEITR
jgi:molybdenum cofactor cytidylyltransferase